MNAPIEILRQWIVNLNLPPFIEFCGIIVLCILLGCAPLIIIALVFTIMDEKLAWYNKFTEKHPRINSAIIVSIILLTYAAIVYYAIDYPALSEYMRK